MWRKGAFTLLVVMLLVGCRNDKKSNDAFVHDSVKEKAPVSKDVRNIVFYGNSITAGYGVEQSEAFPALIQDKIDSLKLSYKVINAGVSGETSAGGKARINWVLQQPVDIF